MESWPTLPYRRNLKGDISIRTRRRGVVRGSVKHKRTGTTPSVPTIAKQDTTMRVAVILLACVVGLSTTQFTDGGVGGNPQRGQFPPAAIRSARYQRLPIARPSAPSQSVFVNQRLRRPIAFRSRGGEDGQTTASFAAVRLSKPGVPATASSPNYPQQIKPVKEDSEEDERSREGFRDHHEREEDRSFEPDEDEEEISEENVSRSIGNTGSNDSQRQSSGPSATQQQQQSSGPGQYRSSYQTASVPVSSTGRGSALAQQAPSVQYRTTPKPTKPRKQPIVDESPFKEQIRGSPPKPSKPTQIYDNRGKKPVAQIIRRYRNDNSDGSITWGFENDDGSYKEEIIGTDCITRGKYGYVDPDGLRREYTYETGIKCDEEQKEEEEENGFVDYQENKLVLPDGKTIDLSSMGKKQSRRPRPTYGH
ncbi:PREDICTED: LOW QUALITY PROTEIN: uncharacterized protein LOC106789138 [Polistes canadensis]|uniref:LOW QUALITY PROTEIN: uncharacterized protein LOC106789138 n=1 Tax=Polistes canadensis TaxID=91411 RepID=UPI000718C487|nr:PREDICTED: LOW QUALITY PROTEIN: uncharacterized protein LOC106789138 [Polistes canadensis]